MNAIRTLSIATLLLAANAATASEPSQELRWECSRSGAPSHREIADAFGYDNYVFVREAQPRLYRQLRRVCQGGASAVLLVLEPRNRIEVRAVATR